MTENFKRTYDLDGLKELVANEQTRSITHTSLKEANELGFSETELVEVVLSLKTGEFCKSMTSFHSHRIWQDVYKCSRRGKKLYIKLQNTDNICVVIQFKKDTGRG